MQTVIEAHNLSRSFQSKNGTKVAVDSISFSIQAGQIYGLLGPNGAGKSTTIKMMTTLLMPTQGKLKILGHDALSEPDKIRSRIGLLNGSESGFYWQLSGRDNLRFFGSLFRIDKQVLEQRIDYWLERVGLTEAQHKLVDYYSKGMKQRLHIARAMLHDPEILFMDEPTLGLDPQGTADLRAIMQEIKSLGRTIILTTHDMEEAHELCDESSFIVDGKIVREGTYHSLQDSFQEAHTYEIELLHSPVPLLSSLQTFPFTVQPPKELPSGHYVVRIEVPKSAEGQHQFSDVIQLLTPCIIVQIVLQKIDLRSIYLQLVSPTTIQQKDHSA